MSSKKWKIISAIIMIIVIIIMFSCFPYIFARGNLAKAEAEYKKAGFATTAEEFENKYIKPAPPEKCADIFLYKIEKIFTEASNDEKLVIVGTAEKAYLDQKLPEESQKYAREFLDKNKEYFSSISKVRDFPLISYNWHGGNKNLPRETSNIRHCIKRLALAAEIAVIDNNRAKAFEILEAMFHICKSSTQGPSAIEQLINYANIAITNSVLERCFNNLQFNNDELLIIEKYCKDIEQLIFKAWPILWEFETSVFKIPAEYDGFIKAYGLSSKEDKIIFTYYYYSGKIVNSLANEMINRKQILQHRLKTFSNYMKLYRSFRASIYQFSFSQQSKNISGKLFRQVALLRSISTACAIERYQIKYGKIPTSLQKLVPEFIRTLPVDPFNGKPLYYAQGDLKIKYHEIKAPEEDTEAPDSMFAMSESTSVNTDKKYKIISKRGYYLLSVGKDLKQSSTDILKAYPSYPQEDIITIVVDKNQR